MLILFLIENHTNGCTVVSGRKKNQFVGTTKQDFMKHVSSLKRIFACCIVNVKMESFE